MYKAEIENIISEALAHSFSEEDNYRFRSSALPYCARRDLITRLRRMAGEPVKRLIRVSNRIAMDNGTAMHAVLQAAMSEEGKLFGDWECAKCSSIKEMQLFPGKCCGHSYVYKELFIDDEFIGFSGHVDAVIQLTNDNYALVDFKTVDPKKYKAKSMDPKHILQISAYRYYLRRPPFNLPIEEAYVAYFSREDRPSFKIFEIPDGQQYDKQFEMFQKHAIMTEKAVKTGEIDSLPSYCNSISDEPYCPFNHMCFGFDFKTALYYEWQKAKEKK